MTRAPIKLSRELKLLLLLLLMVALIGAWYVWTNNRAAALATPSTAGTADAGTDQEPPEALGTGTTDTGTTDTGTTGAGTPTTVTPGTATPSTATPDPATGTDAATGAAPGTPTTGDTAPSASGRDNAGTPSTGTSSTGPSTAGATPDGTGLGAGVGQETVPLTPGGGAGPGGATAGNPGALAVQPNRPVEIEVIPPFPTPDVAGAPDSAATPGGINPQASLASVPLNNPFRPLNLDRSAQAASAPATSPGQAGGDVTARTQPTTQASTQTGTASGTAGGSVQTSPITPSSSAGPLAISPVPGAGGSTGVTSGSVSGLPTIPGANGDTGLDLPGSGVASGSAIPGGNAASGPVSGTPPDRTIAGNRTDSGVTVIGGSAASGSGTAGTGRTTGQTPAQGGVVITAPKPPKPVVPPIAGVNVPSVEVPGVTRVPGTASRPASGTASGAGNRTGADAPASGLPVPGTPQVITSLGQGAGDGETSAASSASKLDQFVQKRQLSFNAAVLGPINTAIFRGQDGYVVVAVGQTLPDSQVTVREVNATTAVLSLGNDLKTLELDQR